MEKKLQKSIKKLKNIYKFLSDETSNTSSNTIVEVIKELVDEVVLVSTDEICGAIKDIYDEKRRACFAGPSLIIELG